MRADARRNRERLVAVAREIFEADGPDASLDLVARRAGVGPGTLYRHFPTRRDLQEAVYRETIDETAAVAAELAGRLDPPDALRAWLEQFVAHLSERRGLAATLLETMTKQDELFVECHAAIHSAGGPLLAAARDAGAVRPDVTLSDVLWLVNGIAYAAEAEGGRERTARLLDIVQAGIAPPPA